MITQAAAEEALAIRRRIGDPVLLAESLVIAGWAGIFLAEFERAHALWSENLAVSKRIGAAWNAAEAMIDLGWIDAVMGDLGLGRSRLEQGVATMRRLGSDVYLAYGLFFSGYAALFAGRYREARGYLAESLEIYRRLGGRRLMEPALTVLAGVAASDGAAETAVFLAAATDVLRTELGLAQFPGFHDRIQVRVDAARRSLGRRAPAMADRGREMDFEQALDEALRFATGSPRAGGPADLTQRQVTVAHLVAQGMSNREIAASLSVAQGTVKRHVEDILGKLELERRAPWMGKLMVTLPSPAIPAVVDGGSPGPLNWITTGSPGFAGSTTGTEPP